MHRISNFYVEDYWSRGRSIYQTESSATKLRFTQLWLTPEECLFLLIRDQRL
ncbi:MAG: hypothetical protein ACUVRA_02300 [Candidatus Bathyarchaeaceae archaeon]